MKERTLRGRLAVHIAVRLLVATVLLGAAVIVQLRTPGVLRSFSKLFSPAPLRVTNM